MSSAPTDQIPIKPTTARYSSTCHVCHEPIEPGDLITVAERRTGKADLFQHWWCDAINAPHWALKLLTDDQKTAIRDVMRSPEYRRLSATRYNDGGPIYGNDNDF